MPNTTADIALICRRTKRWHVSGIRSRIIHLWCFPSSHCRDNSLY